jgi:hypothetical protein
MATLIGRHIMEALLAAALVALLLCVALENSRG